MGNKLIVINFSVLSDIFYCYNRNKMIFISFGDIYNVFDNFKNNFSSILFKTINLQKISFKSKVNKKSLVTI